MANAARLNVNALSFRRSWFSCRMLFQPEVKTIQNRETCSFKDSSRSGRQHVTVGDSLRKWKRRFLKPWKTMKCIENETAMYFARSWLTRNDYCRHVHCNTWAPTPRGDIERCWDASNVSQNLPKTLAATVVSRLSCAPLQQSNIHERTFNWVPPKGYI